MSKITVALSLLALSLFCTAPHTAAVAQQPGTELAETGWGKRCQKDPKTGKEDKNQCEAYQKIQVKDADTRIAEMAIGFPTGSDGKKSKVARGVVVLPLGILLESGVLMQVDEQKPAVFKLRFCTQGGCVGYVNLNPELLDTMKNGNQLLFQFKTSQGRDVKIIMSLKGFTKAIKEVG